jgi:protease-4
MLYIESPGGTTVGAEGIHDAITHVAATKPVVVVMGEVAASGGYIAALPANHVVARGNTLTGSIGVILQYPDVTELMDTVGIEMQTFRSSDLKGGLSPARVPTEVEIARQQALVEEAFDWFRSLVAEGRGLSGEALERVANGATFTGRQALELGLIDEIGGLREAESWLFATDEALRDLPQHPLFPPDEELGFLDLVSQLRAIGAIVPELAQTQAPGLMSVMR